MADGDGAAGFGDAVSGSSWGLILRDVEYAALVTLLRDGDPLSGHVALVTSDSVVLRSEDESWSWTIPLEEIKGLGVKDRAPGSTGTTHVRQSWHPATHPARHRVRNLLRRRKS